MAKRAGPGKGRKVASKPGDGALALHPDPIKALAAALTPKLQAWIEQGAEEESKLKAAAIVVNLLEFVQPKLARQVVTQDDAALVANGVGAELRKQIASRLLADVATSDGK